MPDSVLEAEHTAAKDRHGTYIPEDTQMQNKKKSKCDNRLAIAV